jgi:hypothetical protein
MNNDEDIMFGGKKRLRPGSTVPPVETQEIDRASERSGFVSREAVHGSWPPPEPPAIKRRRRPPTGAATTNLTIRAPVPVSNRFVEFTQQTRCVSYWEALEKLMDIAGLDKDGNVPPELRDHPALRDN